MSDKIVKEVQVEITAKDMTQDVRQSLEKWAVADWQRSRSAGVTGGGGAGGGGGFASSAMAMAKSVAVVAAVGYAFEKVADAAERFATAARTGNQNMSEVGAELSKSLPIVGEFARGIESTIEVFTGIKSATELMRRAAEVTDSQTAHMRSMGETARVTSRAWSEAIRNTGFRADNAGATGYGREAMGRSQAAGVRQYEIGKTAEDQERAARESTRAQNEAIRGKLGDALLNGNKTAAAQMRGAMEQNSKELERSVGKIKADAAQASEAETLASQKENFYAERDASLHHTNEMGKLDVQATAVWYAARGQAAKVEQLKAQEEEKQARRDAQEEAGRAEISGDRRLLEEKLAAHKVASATAAEADAAYSRGERYRTQDRELELARTKAEVLTTSLAQSAQTYAADVTAAQAAYDQKVALIKREAEERKRQHQEEAADIDRLAAVKQQAAQKEKEQSLYHATEAAFSRREGMRGRLGGQVQASLDTAARLGMPGAGMASERFKIQEQYASRAAELSRITRDQSATKAEKDLASKMLGGLDKEKQQAMGMAGYRGPSSGLSGAQNSMFGTGVGQESMERAANGIDRPKADFQDNSAAFGMTFGSDAAQGGGGGADVAGAIQESNGLLQQIVELLGQQNQNRADAPHPI